MKTCNVTITNNLAVIIEFISSKNTLSKEKVELFFDNIPEIPILSRRLSFFLLLFLCEFRTIPQSWLALVNEENNFLGGLRTLNGKINYCSELLWFDGQKFFRSWFAKAFYRTISFWRLFTWSYYIILDYLASRLSDQDACICLWTTKRIRL